MKLYKITIQKGAFLCKFETTDDDFILKEKNELERLIKYGTSFTSFFTPLIRRIK